MTGMMRKVIDAFVEFLGDRGAIFLEWISDALGKIATLQFLELTVDQAALLLGCVLIVALVILKLVRRPGPQSQRLRT